MVRGSPAGIIVSIRLISGPLEAGREVCYPRPTAGVEPQQPHVCGSMGMKLHFACNDCPFGTCVAASPPTLFRDGLLCSLSDAGGPECVHRGRCHASGIVLRAAEV